MRNWLCGLAALSVLTTSACASLYGIKEKPRAQVTQVKILSGDRDGVLLGVSVAVENPNPTEITLRELTYDLELAGRPLAKGMSENQMVIPASGRSEVQLPVRVQFQDLFRSLAEIIKKPKTAYRVTGAAKLGWFRIPFEKSGEIEFRQGQLR